MTFTRVSVDRGKKNEVHRTNCGPTIRILSSMRIVELSSAARATSMAMFVSGGGVSETLLESEA